MSKQEIVEKTEDSAYVIRSQSESREERRKKKKETKEHVEESNQEKPSTKRIKKPKVRLIPIWLRLIIVLILCAGGLAGGLVVGYGVVGDGNASDVFQMETWQHIVDLVVKKT